ncbi:MAG: class I SAM-dependent methyltransferase, partial [Alphaproteobacteria bacterium]
MPVEEDIGKAYETYYTHQDQDMSAVARLVAGLVERLRAARYAAEFGYPVRTSILTRAASKLAASLVPRFAVNADCSIMYAPFRPGGRILEVGVGSGQTLKRLQDLGWLVEGIDVDEKAVENANKKGLSVSCGSLGAQKYPDRCFDAVAMSHVIEHLHDVRGVLAECRRILSAGGKLVMVTPNSASWGHRMCRDNWMPLDPPRHLHLFNSANLARLCHEAGFRDVKTFATIRGADG